MEKGVHLIQGWSKTTDIPQMLLSKSGKQDPPSRMLEQNGRYSTNAPKTEELAESGTSRAYPKLVKAGQANEKAGR